MFVKFLCVLAYLMPFKRTECLLLGAFVQSAVDAQRRCIKSEIENVCGTTREWDAFARSASHNNQNKNPRHRKGNKFKFESTEPTKTQLNVAEYATHTKRDVEMNAHPFTFKWYFSLGYMTHLARNNRQKFVGKMKMQNWMPLKSKSSEKKVF